MSNILEVVDKTGRRIHLSKTQWIHIRKKHPEVENYEEIEETLKNPLKITSYKPDQSMEYYYRYFKNKPSPNQYLLVLVKYLNGDGYVIIAYYDKRLK